MMSTFDIVGTIISSLFLLAMLVGYLIIVAKEYKEVSRLRRKQELLTDLLYRVLCDTYPDLAALDSDPN